VEHGPEGLEAVPYRFTGKELDEETGLYYYGARYFNPRTSRWISADPGLETYLPVRPVDDEARQHNRSLPGQGGVFNYVNLQPYHYGGNNPLRYTDPTGLQDEPGLWQRLGAALKKLDEKLLTFQKNLLLKEIEQYKETRPEQYGRAKAEVERAYYEAHKRLDLVAKAIYGVPENPTLEVKSGEIPETAANIASAQAAGQPIVLTYDPQNAIQRRNQALKASGLPSSPLAWRDEYPFATTMEGGAGAQVRYVPAAEQQIQAGQLSSFYQRNRLQPGDRFYVRVR
jgi:RHS repeat-associated protein